MTDLNLASPFFRWLNRPFTVDFEENQWPGFRVISGLDVYEEEDKIIVKAPVPGIPADKVDVTYENGVLRIKAKVEEEEEKKKKRVMYRRGRVTSFDYTTTLPRPIEEKSLDARVEDGVVTVSANIAERAKPKKITVKAAGK